MFIDIVSRLLPVFLIIGLGSVLRITKVIGDDMVDGLRTIIVNVSLPALLFLTFMRMEIKAEFIYIILVIFLFCVLLYVIGRLIVRFSGAYRDYIPFLVTGFEFGMVGTVFFGAAFGLENISYIAVIDLGQEIFIWFVYLSLLRFKENPTLTAKDTVSSFLKSPVIIGVLLGLLFNLLGLQKTFESGPLGNSVVTTLDYLTNLTIPLILIVIGHGLRFQRENLKDMSLFIGFRLIVVLSFAVLIDVVLLRSILQLPLMYSAALYTFVLLPPPFILPLFANSEKEHKALLNNTLVFYSGVSVILFSVFFIIFSMYSNIG